jgi:hypothetical protein
MTYNVRIMRSLRNEVEQIWVEKSAKLRNLISLVIFPAGLKFSATSRREISEFLKMPLIMKFTKFKLIPKGVGKYNT